MCVCVCVCTRVYIKSSVNRKTHLFEADWEKMKLNEPGMQKLEKAKSLAVGEACSACYNLKHFMSHGFLAKRP